MNYFGEIKKIANTIRHYSHGKKTYVSLNPNLTKEEAIEDARINKPQAAWSLWIGKDEPAKLFNNDFGTGTYAFTQTESIGYPTQKP